MVCTFSHMIDFGDCPPPEQQLLLGSLGGRVVYTQGDQEAKWPLDVIAGVTSILVQNRNCRRREQYRRLEETAGWTVAMIILRGADKNVSYVWHARRR